jgi:hypothetical protein
MPAVRTSDDFPGSGIWNRLGSVGQGKNNMKFIAKLVAGVLYATLLTEHSMALAANWKLVAVDSRYQHDGNSRVVEIDLDSIERRPDEISVSERETRNDITGGGYSCREGDIRHGITSKDIAAIFCRSGLPDHYPGPHKPSWVTYKTQQTTKGVSYEQYDSAGQYIINHDFAPLSWRQVTISVYQVSYDCRGYYRLAAEWIWLDTTDKIGGAPRGYVSPERQVSNWVCAKRAP